MLGEVETGQQHAGRDLGVGEHALVDLHLVDQASEAGAADHVDRGDDIVHLRPRVRRADLRAVDVHGQSGCLAEYLPSALVITAERPVSSASERTQ